MTATAACDHADGETLNQVYQRAMASGTELRPVVTNEDVRRVLTMSGVGRLVPVYANVAGALAATRPGDNIAVTPDGPPGRARAAVPPGGDVGTEVALLDRDGAIRDALAGDLPGSLTVELPCHSPHTERWFDTLISARQDEHGHVVGATVTLSLTRSQTRVLLPAGTGRPAWPAADAALVGEMTERLAGVGRILEATAAEACPNLAGQLHRALGELDAVIRDAHTAIAPPDSGSRG
jgi:hypothetical protein